MNYPHIRPSRKFYGKFEVALSEKENIPCHNLATARSTLKNLKCENEQN